MADTTVGLIGFAAVVTLLSLRVPVGITLITVAFGGYAVVVGWEPALVRLGSDLFTSASVQGLSVIPLFIFMGLTMERAGLGKDLYALFYALLMRVRGGLAMVTICAATVFGAVSGSALASSSTMSLVAVPEMRKHGYDDRLATGTAAVGGSLGMLIPPSAALVIYALLTEESIGQTLLGGLVPGVIVALLLIVTVYSWVKVRPEVAPIPTDQSRPSVLRASLLAWPVPAVFGLTMGGIYLGVFTPTEAGAVGATLCLLYALLAGRLSAARLVEALGRTVSLSAAIFLIMIGGKMFGFFMTVSGVPSLLSEFVSTLQLPSLIVIIVIFAIYFGMGMMMDELGILVIMTPIIYPIVISLGYDGVWFGVLSIMMLMTGLLTPPVGIVSFVVSQVADVDLLTVFRGIGVLLVPLVLAVLLVAAFPQLALFLPELMR